MPWKPSDAPRKTRKASTEARRRAWAKVANKTLAEGHSEASAIRIANSRLKGRKS